MSMTIDVGRIHTERHLTLAAGLDLETLKARQQATWSAGDYGRIGVRLQAVGESLCEAVELLSNETVLDVAAGDGNASLAAARRFAHVTSTDYVPNSYVFRYRSAEHWVEFFRAYYGPTHKAFAALDPVGQRAFETALLDFLNDWNQGKGEALAIPGEYLEAVVRK